LGLKKGVSSDSQTSRFLLIKQTDFYRRRIEYRWILVKVCILNRID
jgi:hypothetical protein